MAHMESDVQNIAAALGLEIPDLFDKAYMDCRGFIWGIAGPQAQYQNWKNRNGPLPRYVLDFLRLHGAVLLN
jgi:hypothetical protein